MLRTATQLLRNILQVRTVDKEYLRRSNSPDRILPRWVTERLPSLRDNLNQRHHSHLEIDALVPGRYQNNPSHIGGVTLRIYRRAYRRIL